MDKLITVSALEDTKDLAFDGTLVYGYKDGYRVIKRDSLDAHGLDEFSFSEAPCLEQGASACADLEMQVEGVDGPGIRALSLVDGISCGQDGGQLDQSEDKENF